MCNHKLILNEAIERWDEAIPIGNGHIGALIWGDGYPLKFSLDRGDIWDTRSQKETSDENFNYKNLIKLVKSYKHDEITKRFDNFYEKPTPTKIPAGKLFLKYKNSTKNIISKLNLKNAICEIELDFGEEKSFIKTYLHSTKKYGYIEITGVFPTLSIESHDFSAPDNDDKISENSTKSLGYPKCVIKKTGNIWYTLQKTCEHLEFGIITNTLIEKDKMKISYFVGANLDGDNWIENSISLTENALLYWENDMKIHQKWWSGFWEKSSLCLPDKNFEYNWYLANYFFACCSRKGYAPMPLQGVWTADEGTLPPWKGDYHHDLNTQLCYSHFLKANHVQEGESFIDFLIKLVPEAEEFSKSFFDSDGICLPSVMSIKGQPLGGWPQYCLNLTNQLWLCGSFIEYYKYTNDKNFLKNTAYDYIRKSAICLLGLLEYRDDKLVLPLSSSPELHDNTMHAWLKDVSNYDLSLIFYVFQNLESFALELGMEDHEMWNDVLCLIDRLSYDHKGFKIAKNESLNESHRHLSHCMAIYPLELINYKDEKSKEIIDNTILNLEALGTGYWVGYTFTWMSLLYAKQLNGEGAAYQLKLFFENFCSINGFHLNGDYKKRGLSTFHYRPFTLEGNIFAATAIQEMVLQNVDEIIHVFPAVPLSWKKTELAFENFRVYGGILVSAKILNEKLEYIKLVSSGKIKCCVKNTFDGNKIKIFAMANLKKLLWHKIKTFLLKLWKIVK